jgi:hypothetical protein
MGAFTLMAIFHAYALAPILNRQELTRICAFFIFNGLATVSEAALWGKKKHWVKAILAWIFEISISTWTARGLTVPNGLSKIPWKDICTVKSY